MRAALAALTLAAAPAAALDPADVFVMVNKAVPASRQVADHYCRVRKVPAANVVALDLPAGEDISRADYDARLAGPLRDALKDRKADVKVLLTVYGVPLRVGGVVPSADEKAAADKLTPELDEAKKTLAELEKAKPRDEAKITAARSAVDRLDARRRRLTHAESQAAVDSELMLLWWPDYPKERWVGNPLYFQLPAAERKKAPPTLMTARLDGPTPDIAKRLADDAVAVEATGLAGKVYVDARGIKFDPAGPDRRGTGYGGYDESFREMAALLKAGGLDVTLDDKNALFPPDSCPDAALYAGWYSHANYVPCCRFVRGAVAWHLASSEATTLRNDKSKVWCPNLLKAGVAATVGPVAEPYTVGFPKPAEFFGLLATGKYTLVECYARTVLFASWMGVLVGDPLYNPYGAKPAVREADVKPSPKGAVLFGGD